MPRFDMGTGLMIDEACAIDDFILCTVDPGNICFPWVGKCTMSLRVILWATFVIYACKIFSNLYFSSAIVGSAYPTLRLVLGLALGCGVFRLVRDIVIIAVPYQGISSIGTVFDMIWYLSPDVVTILTLCGIYTLQFFTLTASQRIRELGVRVMYASHGVSIIFIMGGGIAVALGYNIVFGLVLSVLALVIATLTFFLYFGNKVRKQLLKSASTSSSRAAQDVGDFLQRYVRVVIVTWGVYSGSSLTTIILTKTVPSHSSAVCSTMQLIHRGVECGVLAFWAHHVGHMVSKSVMARTASAAQIDSKQEGSRRSQLRKNQSRTSTDIPPTLDHPKIITITEATEEGDGSAKPIASIELSDESVSITTTTS